MIPPRTAAADRRRTAFTLTELIVVIAIIVLLVSLLLAALGKARDKSRQTSTLATMRAFSAACESFHQEHDFYPGIVPERTLADDTAGLNGSPIMSGTENAMFHLMGGFVRETDVGSTAFNDTTRYPAAAACSPVGWHDVGIGGSGQFNIKLALDRLGEGPTIGNKPFAPYFTPSASDIGAVEGQMSLVDCGADSSLDLPDLIDAWGQPIIYLRRQRTVGPLTAVSGSGTTAQFSMAPMRPYLEPTRLGRLGQDQAASLFNTHTDTDQEGFLSKILEHPALPGQARGAFMLLSAGGDGVYYSSKDGAGSDSAPVTQLVEVMGSDVDFLNDFSAETLKEYDDVLQFGGS